VIENFYQLNGGCKMTQDKAVSATDPPGAEKLAEKLRRLEKLQGAMKEVNAYWRRNGTCKGAPGMTDAQAEKLDAKVRWEQQPFSRYALLNINSEIKRLKTRIEAIAYYRKVSFSGWTFDGGRAEANEKINRLQLFFDERPDGDKHSTLRHAGFVYSHTNGAYQRQLNNNAIYAARRLAFVKPADGRTVREHQSKAPSRDDGAR
jgi:hypothetical protein